MDETEDKQEPKQNKKVDFTVFLILTAISFIPFNSVCFSAFERMARNHPESDSIKNKTIIGYYNIYPDENPQNKDSIALLEFIAKHIDNSENSQLKRIVIVDSNAVPESIDDFIIKAKTKLPRRKENLDLIIVDSEIGSEAANKNWKPNNSLKVVSEQRAIYQTIYAINNEKDADHILDINEYNSGSKSPFEDYVRDWVYELKPLSLLRNESHPSIDPYTQLNDFKENNIVLFITNQKQFTATINKKGKNLLDNIYDLHYHEYYYSVKYFTIVFTVAVTLVIIHLIPAEKYAKLKLLLQCLAIIVSFLIFRILASNKHFPDQTSPIFYDPSLAISTIIGSIQQLRDFLMKVAIFLIKK